VFPPEDIAACARDDIEPLDLGSDHASRAGSQISLDEVAPGVEHASGALAPEAPVERDRNLFAVLQVFDPVVGRAETPPPFLLKGASAMRITAKVPNTKTLRGSYVGSLKQLDSYITLREGTTAENPVYLIAGCEGLELGADASGAEFSLHALAPGRQEDRSRHLLRVGAGVEVLRTRELVGLHRVTATPRAGAGAGTAHWFVCFAKVEVIDPPDFDSNRGGYSFIDNSLAAGARGVLTAKVRVEAGLAANYGRIHTGFIQNFIDTENRTFGRYEWGEARNAPIDPRRTMLEPLPDATAPYVDSERDDDWRDTSSGSAFPFVGTPVTGEAGPVREVKVDDSPAGTFPLFLDRQLGVLPVEYGGGVQRARNNWLLRGVGGQNKFLVGLSARTADAPRTFLTFRLTSWRMKANLSFVPASRRPGFKGYYASPQLLAPGSFGLVCTEVLSDRAVSPPLDARMAGLEVYGPNAAPDDELIPDPKTQRWLNFWLPLL
jgi:hypothetical protein